MTPIARSFLTDHPDVAGLSEILRQLALRATVDEPAIERRGRRVAAPLHVAGSDLSGRFTVLNNLAIVDFVTPRGQPLPGAFAQRTFHLQFLFGADGPIMPRLSVQYDPPSRHPAEQALREAFTASGPGTMRRTGCNVYLTAAGGPKMTPLTCRLEKRRLSSLIHIRIDADKSRPLAAGATGQGPATDLAAFDLWYERLRGYRPTP